MLEQISIYAENKKGTLQKITDILEKAEINIMGSVTNDTAEFGIIRMVVSDPDKTVETLTANGFLCRKVPVLGIEIADEVGNLNKLLKALLDSNVNADYQYLSFNRETGKPIMVLHTPDVFEVETCLQRLGFVSL